MVDLAVPDEVVRMHLAVDGEAGKAWLEELPGIVNELRVRWDLTLGPAFEGGSVAFVAPAERPDGERVVLKVSSLDDETRHEADALAVWNGDGAVRLLDAVPHLGALLLERLEPGTLLGDDSDRDGAITIACALLRRLWRPVPEDHPFQLARDLAGRWAHELPERFARRGVPFELGLLRWATEACLEVEVSEEEAIVNRDFHLWNVLAARREAWLLIDPKPLVGERAFDTGHFLRTLLPEEPADGQAELLVRRLAAELDLEAERVRLWAFVRAVEDTLWGLEAGFSDFRRDLDFARSVLPSL